MSSGIQPLATASSSRTAVQTPVEEMPCSTQVKSEQDTEKGTVSLESDRDPKLVTIERNDPWHPYNHSQIRKWISVASVSSAAVCVTCGSSIASMTISGIETDLNVSREVAVLAISLFVFGLGLGPLLAGPLSEFIGRKPIYVVTTGAFTLFNLPVAFANNVAVHLIFRFLCGFAGSSMLSVAAGTVVDLFENKEVAIPMAVFSISPFIGPVLGPLLGGFAAQHTGTWRSCYYIILGWSALEFLLICFLPETFLTKLTVQKAKSLRAETGDQELYACTEKSRKSLGSAIMFSCVTPFQIMATEPIALVLNTYCALLLGILYMSFGSFPVIFTDLYNFSLQETGALFVGFGLGMAIACSFTFYFGRVYQQQIIKHGGKAPPEIRLIQAMYGAPLIPIGLAIFAGTTQSQIPWIAPILGTVPFGVGIVFIFSGVFTYLVDYLRPVAASAMASNSFLRSTFACIFPLFGTQMFMKLGYQGGGGLLTGLTLLMMPLPFVLFKFGHRLRQRPSRFAVKD